ncbi:hypothetical protein M409DRAFT_18435 [Zasmidium cellare ATCC 36951]|uniref:Uncharacterized protein n=1 Tax=Zasmidium cellare ATCC 36951 TaxID=1080233 RepID=A0A6A6CW33_ZASCE|nr:uncharacterized protein M409DRAFT_18435 [Zasmidium cellare ATCC 36951]KAF2171321.1 hypothetical protein M409DRAFT_18435 [Zasmidium cellare ATCC 36951]
MILVAGPALLKNMYYGKFWTTQARFFGVQGLADINMIERSLFGLSVGESNEGRLKWSTSGSLQSSGTKETESGHFEGVAPASLPEKDEEGKYLFTVIDTYSLEATAFYADRPPTVVLVCGRANGMQRAVLCSYDWTTQTFTREVVLRMKTIVLNRMFRVDQCRVAFRR